jgi:hypothetical protein
MVVFLFDVRKHLQISLRCVSNNSGRSVLVTINWKCCVVSKVEIRDIHLQACSATDHYDMQNTIYNLPITLESVTQHCCYHQIYSLLFTSIARSPCPVLNGALN